MALPPPGEAATYPAREIANIVAFLDNLTNAFESDPGARDEFFALVTAFGSGHGGTAAAVVARATDILAARPALLAQFSACLSGTQDEALSVARPRRSNRSTSVVTMVPADDDDPDEVDDANEKREREPSRRANKHAAAAEMKEEKHNPRLAEAIDFLTRVKRVAGDEAHWRFLGVVFDAQADRDMDAAAIYDAVREAFGPAHRRLLRRFAATFLPGEAEWMEQQERRHERKRRRNAAGGDHAQSMNTAKKHDGDHALREASRVPDAATRRATTNVDNGGVGSRTVAAPAAVDRFRALWEFATGYSVLLVTMARVEELIELHDLPYDEDNGGGAYSLDLEKLFPSRDSRLFLERMYGSRWRKIRMGFEDGGLAGWVLRVVLDSLRWAEERAVEDARERRDKVRAAEELNNLLTKMVNDEERRGTWTGVAGT